MRLASEHPRMEVDDGFIVVSSHLWPHVLDTVEGRGGDIYRFGVSAAVMWTLRQSVVVKTELSEKAKPPRMRWVYVPIMTERTSFWTQLDEVGFLRRLAWHSTD